jgi:hypothetical protein
MRLVLLALLAAVVSGCGSAPSSPHPSSPRATGPPPGKVQQRNGPPRAWLETAGGSTWLGTGSSCWTDPGVSVCADTAAPDCEQPWVPHVEIASEEIVRAHLGFDPEEAAVEGVSATVDGRTVSWKVTHAGAFTLFARTRGGDASYVACAVLTTKPSAYSGPA